MELLRQLEVLLDLRYFHWFWAEERAKASAAVAASVEERRLGRGDGISEPSSCIRSDQFGELIRRSEIARGPGLAVVDAEEVARRLPLETMRKVLFPHDVVEATTSGATDQQDGGSRGRDGKLSSSARVRGRSVSPEKRFHNLLSPEEHHGDHQEVPQEFDLPDDHLRNASREWFQRQDVEMPQRSSPEELFESSFSAETPITWSGGILGQLPVRAVPNGQSSMVPAVSTMFDGASSNSRSYPRSGSNLRQRPLEAGMFTAGPLRERVAQPHNFNPRVEIVDSPPGVVPVGSASTRPRPLATHARTVSMDSIPEDADLPAQDERATPQAGGAVGGAVPSAPGTAASVPPAPPVQPDPEEEEKNLFQHTWKHCWEKFLDQDFRKYRTKVDKIYDMRVERTRQERGALSEELLALHRQAAAAVYGTNLADEFAGAEDQTSEESESLVRRSPSFGFGIEDGEEGTMTPTSRGVLDPRPTVRVEDAISGEQDELNEDLWTSSDRQQETFSRQPPQRRGLTGETRAERSSSSHDTRPPTRRGPPPAALNPPHDTSNNVSTTPGTHRAIDVEQTSTLPDHAPPGATFRELLTSAAVKVDSEVQTLKDSELEEPGWFRYVDLQFKIPATILNDPFLTFKRFTKLFAGINDHVFNSRELGPAEAICMDFEVPEILIGLTTAPGAAPSEAGAAPSPQETQNEKEILEIAHRLRLAKARRGEDEEYRKRVGGGSGRPMEVLDSSFLDHNIVRVLEQAAKAEAVEPGWKGPMVREVVERKLLAMADGGDSPSWWRELQPEAEERRRSSTLAAGASGSGGTRGRPRSPITSWRERTSKKRSGSSRPVYHDQDVRWTAGGGDDRAPPTRSSLQRTRIIGQPQYVLGAAGMRRYFRSKVRNRMFCRSLLPFGDSVMKFIRVCETALRVNFWLEFGM